MKVILLYLPVIHQGYLRFLKKHEVDKIYIFDKDVLEECGEWLRKDIRALTPQQIVTALQSLLTKEKIESSIETINSSQLRNLAEQHPITIIMPDEDISHEVTTAYLGKIKVKYDSVFLRWDKQNVVAEQIVKPDNTLEGKTFQQKILHHAKNLAEFSPDWWRQVGGIIVKDGEILLAAFNQHVPDHHQTSYAGDPRASFKKGLNIELSVALHAEAALIASAAKQGVSLEGAEIYVTTFPCPPCAKLVAYSGIKHVYYLEGYSMVDGESILKEKGVEITKVE